ncbi:C80 family cysteine peptidase [Sulfurimonas sp.]|uniref:C80 family cysteine peptidase n=1 Tax=Sulfurimonas sp. TaxID=2022749 RepID=UPI002B4843FF|nr:C80 family cysteine peptidase [Sulfurimonas sp.]
MSAVVKFFKKVVSAARYLVTGTYSGTEGNDNIVAVSLSLGWGDGIITKGGNDIVTAAAFSLKVKDTWGNLTVNGAGGYTQIYKSANGNLNYYGASGALKIEHTGNTGNVNLYAIAASSTALRKGISGNMNVWSAAAHTSYKLFTKTGNMYIKAFSAYLSVKRSSNGHKYSSGNVELVGAGAYVNVYSDVDTGSLTGYALSGNGVFKRYGRNSEVDLKLVGMNNEVYHNSTKGNTTVYAVGGRNYIEKKGRSENDYSTGNLNVTVAVLRNNIIHETRYGDTTVTGLAASSKITRIGEEGNATIFGLGIDNEINIQMKKGHLDFTGAGGSNRINIKGSGNSVSSSRTVSVESVGAYISDGMKFILTLPDNFKSGDTIWAKFQDGQYVKGIKFRLDITNNNIKATTLKAKYVTSTNIDFDFESGGSSQLLANISTGAGYGLKNLSYEGITESGMITNGEDSKFQYILIKKEITDESGDNKTINLSEVNITANGQDICGQIVSTTMSSVYSNSYRSNNLFDNNNNSFTHTASSNEQWIQIKLDKAYKIDELEIIGRSGYDHRNKNISIYLGNEQLSNKNIDYLNNSNDISSSDIVFNAGRVGKIISPTLEKRGIKLSEKLIVLRDTYLINSNLELNTLSNSALSLSNILKSHNDITLNTKDGAWTNNIILPDDASIGDIVTLKVDSSRAVNINVDGNVKSVSTGSEVTYIKSSNEWRELYGNVSSIKEDYSSNIKLVGLANIISHTTAKGDIIVSGGGGYTEVTRIAYNASLTANLGGIVNNVYLKSNYGNYTFNGVGAGNILKNYSKDGFTKVIAGGLGNSLTRVGHGNGDIIMVGGGNHINWTGNGNLKAKLGGLTINHLTRRGDGDNEFILVGLIGNIANIYGTGNLTLGGLGLANVIKKDGNGDATIILVGGANIYHQQGSGSLKAFMLGGANVLLKRGNDNIYAFMAGGVNYIGQVGRGNLYAGMLGGANVITKFGDGDAYALMAGGLNVLVQVGNGKTIAVMYGYANILTKIGDGLTIAALFGTANVFTHIGNGNTIGVMIGGFNVFTKVGGKKGDLTIGVMVGLGNVFTHKGDGDTFALMTGGVNVFTKIGGKLNGSGLEDDDLTIAAMFSAGNIFTHIGDGITAALMVGTGNVLTKIGNGLTIGVMVGTGNIYTHVGNGTTLGLMIAAGNIFTKVGDGITIAAMLGSGNIFTHVGDGLSGAVMLGLGNVFTKVGDGVALAIMLTPPVGPTVGNVFTHIGDGLSGALMFGGQANIFTKVGNGLTVAAMIAGKGNIFTHVGDGTTIALMILSKANIFTKVGNGLTLAFMQGDANIMTHVGDGLTVGIAIGKVNIITKVGNNELVVGLYGKANIVTHVSSEASNTFALVKGNLNVITKVGPMDGFTVTVSPLDSIVSDTVSPEDRILARGDITSNPMGVISSVLDGMNTLISSTYNDIVSRRGSMLAGVAIGDANIITHVGRGSTNLLVHGKANIITKVGNGRSIVLANGKANILTVVGDGDSIQAAKGEANIITKIGSGSSAVLAIGKANVVTKVGDGLHIGVMHGKVNAQTVVGDGMVISAQNGNFNLNTRVGNGTNISVAKGKYNLNVQFGDGLGIYAAAGRGNVSIKIGNGDYYGVTIEVGKGSAKDKVKALLSELKGTGISVLASGTISRIVNGDEGGTVTKHGHTTPTTSIPTDLKGIKVSQDEDSTTNTNDFSKNVTRTNENGNNEDYNSSDKNNIENNSKQQAQAATDAQNNANSDSNKVKDDVNRGQEKVEKEKEKVDSFKNDIEKVDTDKLNENAIDLKSFIETQLGSEGSNYDKANVATESEVSGQYTVYSKVTADGSSLRSEFAAINTNVNQHLDTYGQQAQDAITQSKEESLKVDIQQSIDAAKEKYTQAKSDEIKANDDVVSSQSEVQNSKNNVNSATRDANSKSADAQNRATSASSGTADKRKSDATSVEKTISTGFSSKLKDSATLLTSGVVPSGLNADVDQNKVEDELEAGINALRINSRNPNVNHGDKVQTLEEKYTKGKDFVKGLSEVEKVITRKEETTQNSEDSDKILKTRYQIGDLPEKDNGTPVDFNGEHLGKTNYLRKLITLSSFNKLVPIRSLKGKDKLARQIYDSLGSIDKISFEKTIKIIDKYKERYPDSLEKISELKRLVVKGLKYYEDGTKYTTQESLNALDEQEIPFNNKHMKQELLDAKQVGEEVYDKASLSSKEIDAIQWYTSVGFQYINSYLRKSEKLILLMKDNSINAIKGMSKMQTFEGTTYRAFLPGATLESLERKIAVGKLVGDKGFSSTSTSGDFAKSFRSGKKTVILTILDAKGVNIAGLAQSNQAEVLLYPGSHMRIEAIKRTDQNLHIIARYTENFKAGEKVLNLHDGSEIGTAIDKNTSTVREDAIKSIDDKEVTEILRGENELNINHLSRNPDSFEDTTLSHWDKLTTTQKKSIEYSTLSDKKTKMQNYDHQIIVQLEDDITVRDSSFKLALKHPDQTTIIQMSKDGSYKVIYGKALSDVDGKLRISGVGYGRENSDGVKTLGGRNTNDFVDNIKSLKNDLKSIATIDRVSLIGCNLGVNNHIDDNNNDYGKNLITALKDNGITTSVSVRNAYVGITDDGRKVMSEDGSTQWKNKSADDKTVYRFDPDTNNVISIVNDRNKVTVYKYTGGHLGTVDIPKIVSFVWVGGRLSDSDLKNMKSFVDTASDDTKRYLYYDPNALMANSVKKAINAYAKNISDDAGIRIQTIIKLEEQYLRYLEAHGATDDSRISFMVDNLAAERGKLNKFLNGIKKFWDVDFDKNSEGKIELKSVEELFRSSDPKLKDAYNRELMYRGGVLAGASDVIRIAALDKHGGIYTDVGAYPRTKNHGYSSESLKLAFKSVEDDKPAPHPSTVITLFKLYNRLVPNNSLMYAQKDSTFTNFLVNAVIREHNSIKNDIFRELQYKVKTTYLLDVFTVTGPGLLAEYLNVNNIGDLRDYDENISIKNKSSWQSNSNTIKNTLRYKVFILDPDDLTTTQKKEFHDYILANYTDSMDVTKIVVLDSKSLDKEKYRPLFTGSNLSDKYCFFDVDEILLNSSEISVYGSNDTYNKIISKVGTIDKDISRQTDTSNFIGDIKKSSKKPTDVLVMISDKDGNYDSLNDIDSVRFHDKTIVQYDRRTESFTVIQGNIEDISPRFRLNIIGTYDTLSDDSLDLKNIAKNFRDKIPNAIEELRILATGIKENNDVLPLDGVEKFNEFIVGSYKPSLNYFTSKPYYDIKSYYKFNTYTSRYREVHFSCTINNVGLDKIYNIFSQVNNLSKDDFLLQLNVLFNKSDAADLDRLTKLQASIPSPDILYINKKPLIDIDAYPDILKDSNSFNRKLRSLFKNNSLFSDEYVYDKYLLEQKKTKLLESNSDYMRLRTNSDRWDENKVTELFKIMYEAHSEAYKDLYGNDYGYLPDLNIYDMQDKKNDYIGSSGIKISMDLRNITSEEVVLNLKAVLFAVENNELDKSSDKISSNDFKLIKLKKYCGLISSRGTALSTNKNFLRTSSENKQLESILLRKKESHALTKLFTDGYNRSTLQNLVKLKYFSYYLPCKYYSQKSKLAREIYKHLDSPDVNSINALKILMNDFKEKYPSSSRIDALTQLEKQINDSVDYYNSIQSVSDDNSVSNDSSYSTDLIEIVTEFVDAKIEEATKTSLIDSLIDAIDDKSESSSSFENNWKTKLKESLQLAKNELDVEHLDSNPDSFKNTTLGNWDKFSTTQLELIEYSAIIDKNPKMQNYDHQIIVQLEDDKTVKDSSFKLALKHPDQTTIIQMSKDGSYKVIYGKALSDVDGKLRISGVGYGRENSDGIKTLGGRNTNDFVDNIKSLKNDLKSIATIDRVSLIGCNLGVNNHIDDNNNDYGKNLITALKDNGITTSVSVRNAYVGITDDGRKVTSETAEQGSWRNKNQDGKTVYTINNNGDVVSNNNNYIGTVVEYGGNHLEGNMEVNLELVNKKYKILEDMKVSLSTIDKDIAARKILSQVEQIHQTVTDKDLLSLMFKTLKDIDTYLINNPDKKKKIFSTGNQNRINESLRTLRFQLKGPLTYTVSKTDNIDKQRMFDNQRSEFILYESKISSTQEIKVRDVDVKIYYDQFTTTDEDKLLVETAVKNAIEKHMKFGLYFDSLPRDIDVIIRRDGGVQTQFFAGSLKNTIILGKSFFESTDLGGVANKYMDTANTNNEKLYKKAEATIFHELVHAAQESSKSKKFWRLKSNNTTKAIDISSDISAYATSNPLEFVAEALTYKAYIGDVSDEINTELSKYFRIEDSINIGIPIKHLENINNFKDTQLYAWEGLTLREFVRLQDKKQTKVMQSYDHQIIVQLEDDKTVKDSAYKLAFKHPDQTTIIQMSKDGSYKVIYGKALSDVDGKLRISGVGYGRENSDGVKTLGGRNTNDFVDNIKSLKNDLKSTATIDRVSLIGCNLGVNNHIDDNNNDYGKNLITALKDNGISTSVSIRNTYVGITDDGRKVTSETAEQGSWRNKNQIHKTVYSIDENRDVTSSKQSISGDLLHANTLEDASEKLLLEDSNRLVSNDRGNIQDVDFNKVGDSLSNDNVNPNDPTGINNKVIDSDKITEIDSSVKKIGDSDSAQRQLKKERFDQSIFDAKTTKKTTKQKLASVGANIQINVGDGEHTTLYYGSNNIDIKIGNGGHKTAMFGDNNALMSIGNRENTHTAFGEASHTVEVGGYTAFEGVQILVGQRNIAYNYGDRNDFIVMLDKSVPIIPLLNPFEGASGISSTLKKIAETNSDEREALWTFDKAKTFSTSMSVLDITSTVEYTTLLDVGSENDISDRGIKYDTEASLNNAINGGGSTAPVSKEEMKKMKLKDKAKAKLKNAKASVSNTSINFIVTGRGSDIILANGNFSFIFGDNIQSALDTTVASLFGVMQQGFTSTGAPTNTFTFSPADLKTQLGNNIKNRLASLTEDTTVGEMMNYAYTQDGHVYSQDGQKVDVGNMVSELFTTILKDSYKGLIKTFTNPTKIINTIKEMGGAGVDMIKNGLGALGLPVGTEDEDSTETTTVTTPITQEDEIEGKSFGFSGLKMPSFFDILKIPTMLTKIPALVEDLGKTLTGDVNNMKDKMLTFFTETGYMKDDGDLIVSLGSQNFVWGGHGKDLIALLGVNNNVWAGEGDDVGYLMGEGNTFSGNNGNDTAVMMGQNHMFIGGMGNDLAIASGRYNNLFGGAGNDQLWVFGSRGLITGGEGDDYIVATGNNHDINAGIGNDFSVTMGSGNKIYLGVGDDQAKIFGNKNKLVAGEGKDIIDIYSYDSVIQTDNGNDTVMARSKSKNNKIYTGAGDDTIFIGGLNNEYSAGTGQDIFIMTKQNIEGRITDIEASDMIVFNNFSYKDLWFERSLNNLIIHNYNGGSSSVGTQDWFEEFGAITVDDYFKSDNKRASIVTSVKTDLNGKIVEYEYFDNNAFDKLVEIMASSDRTKGSDGFMTNKPLDFKNDISLAWNNRSDAARVIA